MMKIRRAHKDDVSTILDIEERSFSYSWFSRRAVSYHIKNNLVLCATIDGVVAGYICLSPLTKTKKRRVYSVAVSPDYRKRGIAEALMREAHKQCDADIVTLEVDEKNSSAINLYNKLGYTQFGYYKHYYGNHKHALRLKKVLK